MLLEQHTQQAIRAHNGTSFSPERRGESLISDYGEELQADINYLLQYGASEEATNDYKGRYERFFSSWLSSKSRIMSPMISGPANFPVRRMEKIRRSEENHYKVFREWRERAKKAIIRKAQPEKTYTSELERYRAELEGMKKNHELMKEGNKRIKQALKDMVNIDAYLISTFNIPPHMLEYTMKWGFGLTNNNANMKRVEQRIKELEAKENRREKNPITNYTFDGGTMVINYEIDRIQIMFDARPTSEELTQWKAKGLSSFNWSPSAMAWQRKITQNAMFTVKNMLTGIKKLDG